MYTLVLATLFALLPVSGSAVQEAASSDLRLRSGDVELAATLAVPSGQGRRPAVVLLHGSGPGTRRELQRFAEHFHSLGIATLVYDKRGSGQSTGSWTSASLEDSVADAQAALRALQSDSRIDPQRIGVWGVSQAAWFIPVLASREPSLAFAIVLTGGGATPREVELFMHRASLDRAAVTGPDRAAAEHLLSRYFEWLGTGVGRAEVVDLLARARSTTWYKAIPLDGVMPSDANRPNWEWVARFDPAPFIGRMTLPTLVLLGGADRMGSPTVAAERWQRGLGSAGNTRSKVIIIDGMGHAATIGAEHQQGGATMPRYVSEVAAFVRSLWAGSAVTRTVPGDPTPMLLYDHAASRVALVTGSEGTDQRIWHWDGHRWTAAAGPGPSPRTHAGVAFDSTRGRLVLVGGVGANNTFPGDHWEWDGKAWMRFPDIPTGPRDHVEMVYDEHRGVVVMFGGIRRASLQRDTWVWARDTWEWDGRTWRQIDVPGPEARVAHRMVYDSVRKHVVLFGGGDAMARRMRDTWSWDGTRWRKLADDGPPSVAGHSMAFDRRVGVAWLLLNPAEATTEGSQGLWRWDGQAWSVVRPDSGPRPRLNAGLAYDIARGRTVLYGGVDMTTMAAPPASRVHPTDTWEWDGTRWTQANATDAGTRVQAWDNGGARLEGDAHDPSSLMAVRARRDDADRGRLWREGPHGT